MGQRIWETKRTIESKHAYMNIVVAKEEQSSKYLSFTTSTHGTGGIYRWQYVAIMANGQVVKMHL